jgi:hypothetical protein
MAVAVAEAHQSGLGDQTCDGWGDEEDHPTSVRNEISREERRAAQEACHHFHIVGLRGTFERRFVGRRSRHSCVGHHRSTEGS